MEPSRIPSNMFLIAPNNTGDIFAIGIRADSSGTVKLRTINQQDVTINMAAGEILPVVVTRVYATGTTVATLHGFS